jgi:hypothetical protein
VVAHPSRPSRIETLAIKRWFAEKGGGAMKWALHSCRNAAYFDPKRRRARSYWVFLALLVLALLTGVGARPAGAATTAVNCTTESGALASALASANDGDTLSIQGTCKGTFEISHNLTLTGSGGATLDGQKADTVLTVDSGKTMSIVDLIVTGGFATSCCPGGENGGGIWNNGTLTLTNSTVRGNATSFSGNGAGIFNTGTLTLSNSTVAGNSNSFSGGGAGIFNAGTLTLSNSTVVGNSTSFGPGGGIYNAGGTLVLDNSTVSGNTGGLGGGIENSGTTTITSSTISGNTTGFGGGGGGIANFGALTLTNITISGNTTTSFFGNEHGGGIYNVGTLAAENATITANRSVEGGGLFTVLPATLVNTIVAGQAAGGNCAAAGGGAISDGGYNLEDGTSCGFSTANNSLPNTNPLLDPAGLQSNGGPTQTIALLPGSPAIDAIPPGVNGCGTTFTSDQRGVTRPQGSRCDIGAYEVTQATPAQLLAALRTAVIGVGPGTSLADKVAQALTYLNSADVSDTCSTLSAFVNELTAQSGKTIPQAQAATLITNAQQIKTLLGC